MKCLRCGGYLTIEPSIDFYQPKGRWRCVNCGNRTAATTSPSSKLSIEYLRRTSLQHIQAPLSQHIQAPLSPSPPMHDDLCH